MGHASSDDSGPSARVVPPRLVVPLLTTAWLGLAAAGLALVPDRAVRGTNPVPAVVLVVLFGVAQTFVVNVQLRREARSVFLSEVPTFLALLSLTPGALLAVRVLGALLGFGVLRRQYRKAQKLVFNLALSAAEAAVSVVVFRLLVAPGAPAPLAWLAAATGTAAASAFTAFGVGLVIDMLEGSVRVLLLVRLALQALLLAVPVAALGASAWAAWAASPWAAVPLAVVSVVLLAGYRAYAQLRERHLALERLYRFSQVMSHAPGVDDVLLGVLQQAREILHSERARLTFVQDAGGGEGVEVVLEGEGPLRRGAPQYLPRGDWALARALDDVEPVHLPRGSRNPGHRAWLDAHRGRVSLMVPLMGEAGPLGVLAVDDRLGEARGLEPEDVRVLQTVANQAAVALRNGELLDRLRHESLHDPLTGLPNRAQLQRELEARLGQLPQRAFTVGILDLDAFKDVNDTLGHQQGDRLLCEVARRMVTALDGQALVARLGGDEFAVLADGSDTAELAERLGRRLHASLEAPVLLSGIEVNVSGSLGIALAPEHGTTAGVLLKRADQAMYDAKHNGRQVRVFDPTLDTSSLSKLALVAELRQAIDNGDLEVHVQPKVSSGTGRLCGTEALARWSTPERGPVSPADFVALAERSGLIRPLTELVLDLAIQGCASWQSAAPGVGVSVNVSVRSLADDGLVRLVDRLLRRHGLPPELLTLEITESHIMADPAGTLDVLHQLRARGLRLSVDDFGTGYSSLSYLRRLPVDEVKIDRSFVYRMVEEPDDAAIVRSIVELARTLSLHVVAEGVEDRQTWQALDELGVDEIQGWVVSQALPVQSLAPWFRSQPAMPPRLRAV